MTEPDSIPENSTSRFAPSKCELGMIWISVIVVVSIFLIPQQRWASSGTLLIPVQVTVFNLMTGEPIAEAAVTIIRAYSVHSHLPLEEYSELLRQGVHPGQVPRPQAGFSSGLTGPDGMVSIPVEFETSASHASPQPKAHTHRHWVVVSAPGYPAIAYPLSDRFHETKTLKSRHGLQTQIGLMSAAPNSPER